MTPPGSNPSAFYNLAGTDGWGQLDRFFSRTRIFRGKEAEDEQEIHQGIVDSATAE